MKRTDKKTLLTFFATAAILLLGLCITFVPLVIMAEENEDVQIEVTADPTALSASEPVTLTFTVSNYSEYELRDIAISQGTVSYTVEGMEDNVIPPGGTGIYPLTIEYPDKWIGLPVEFNVSYLKYAEPYSHTLTLTVERTEEPIIGLTRTVSTTQARTGEPVTVTYELINDTKFDMENITLIDEEVSDNAIFRNHTLYAGSHVTQTCVYTMKNTDLLSAPVITYDVNGKTKTFSAVEPVTVKLADVRLSLQVETGDPSAAGVPFILTVRNPGNIGVENISVCDDRSQTVSPDVFSLDPGEERALSFNILPALTESVRNVRFTVIGVDALGAAYEYADSGVYPVYPYVDDAQIDVTLKAECVSAWDAERRTVRVRFTILNYSEVVLTNARVSEELYGVVGSYDSLVTGNTVFEQELSLETPRNLMFSVFATDPAGTERLLTATPLTVEWPEETPAPEQETVTPVPETEVPEDIPQKQHTLSLSDTILRALIIIGVILVTGFIALIVLTVLEQNKTGGILFDPDDDDDDDGEDLIDMSVVETQSSRETEKRRPGVENSVSADTAALKQTPPAREKPRGASDYIRIAAQRHAEYDSARNTPRAESTMARNTERTAVIPPVSTVSRVPEKPAPAGPDTVSRGVFKPPVRTPQIRPAGSGMTVAAAAVETERAGKDVTDHTETLKNVLNDAPAIERTNTGRSESLATAVELPHVNAEQDKIRTDGILSATEETAPPKELSVQEETVHVATEENVNGSSGSEENEPEEHEQEDSENASVPAEDAAAATVSPAVPRRAEIGQRPAVRTVIPDRPRHIGN